MEIISTKDIHPIHMQAGDALRVKYTDPAGVDHTLDTLMVAHPQLVDQIIFFKTANEFGLKCGIGAIFGEKE